MGADTSFCNAIPWGSTSRPLLVVFSSTGYQITCINKFTIYISPVYRGVGYAHSGHFSPCQLVLVTVVWSGLSMSLQRDCSQNSAHMVVNRENRLVFDRLRGVQPTVVVFSRKARLRLLCCGRVPDRMQRAGDVQDGRGAEAISEPAGGWTCKESMAAKYWMGGPLSILWHLLLFVVSRHPFLPGYLYIGVLSWGCA